MSLEFLPCKRPEVERTELTKFLDKPSGKAERSLRSKLTTKLTPDGKKQNKH